MDVDSVSFKLGARERPDDLWAQRDAAARPGAADTAVLGEKGLPDPVSSLRCVCYLGLGLPGADLEAKN